MLLATPFTTVDASLNRAHATGQVLVADRSCSQIQALAEGAQLPVLAGEQQGHPLEWISRGLRQRRAVGDSPRVLHLIAHGRPGAFRMGETWVDAEALKSHAAELAQWGVETIALWSCRVGADAGFVALLEELSGARVLASNSWLGREAVGNEQLQLGDWQLSDLVDPLAWPAQFRLEAFDDELAGSNQADQLDAGAGDDAVDGGAGDDVLDGGAGADELSGGQGDDALDGGKGDDSLTGGEGQDDFELSDGNDVILDFEDSTDVISVRSYKDLSLEQDGDDVLIIRDDQQTRVLNTSVDAVADSLVRIDARLEKSPLTDTQRDDLRAAFRRLLAGKAVDADAISDELNKDQKKGMLRSLRSVMKREPLVSDDALSQITDEQKQVLLTEVKQLLNGREISAGQLGSIFSKQEKEALKDYLAGMSAAAYGGADNACITNQSQFPGENKSWDGCDEKDNFKAKMDWQYGFNNVTLNGNGGDDLIHINVDWVQSSGSFVDGGEGQDSVEWRGQSLIKMNINSEVIDVRLNGNNQARESSLCGEKVDLIVGNDVERLRISGSDIDVKASGNGSIAGSSIYGGESIDDLIKLKAGNDFVNSTVAAGSGDDNIIIQLSGNNKFDGTFVDAGPGNDDINVSSPFISGGTLYGGSGDDKIAYDAKNVGLLNNISIRLSSSNVNDKIKIASLKQSNRPVLEFPRGSEINLSGKDADSGLVVNNGAQIELSKDYRGPIQFNVLISPSNSQEQYLTAVDIERWEHGSDGKPFITIKQADYDFDDYIKGDDCVPGSSPGPGPGPEPDPIEVVGQIQSIEPGASCQLELTRSQKDCVFIFKVSLDQPNTSLQQYIYTLTGSGGKAEDYVFEPQPYQGVTYLPDETSNGNTGKIEVDAGIKEFDLAIIASADKKLTGNEQLTLSLALPGAETNAVVETAQLNEDCAGSASILEIDAKAACEIEETKTKKDARFEYVVTLDPNYGLDQSYQYLFTPDGESLSKDGYDIKVQIKDVEGGLINRAGKVVVNPENNSGILDVGAGVSQFTFVVDVKANSKLKGNEKLSLKLDGLEGTDGKFVEKEASLDSNLCTLPDNPCLNDDQGSAYFYGIDDQNNIWEVNPLKQDLSLVNKTGLGIDKASNGIAYDPEREQVFFFYNKKKIYYWPDRTKQGLDSLKELEIDKLGNIANAAFYEDSIWWFVDEELKQLKLTYSNGGNLVSGTNLISHSVEGYPGGGYGDIAVDKNGILYGSQSSGNKSKTGKFFKVDLKAKNYSYEYLGFSKVDDLRVGLQLSFDAAGERLFGQTHGNVFENDKSKYAFQFFEFERKNGEFTGEIKKLDYQPQEYNENADLGEGFRDFGGSTFYPVDPDCVPPVVPGLVLNIEADGACIEESNASEAIFTFEVEITKPVNTDQDFYYQFLPSPEDSGAYKINSIYLNGSELKDFDPSRLEGKFTIKPGSFPENGKIKIDAEIARIDGNLFKDEAIRLRIDNQELTDVSPSDEAKIKNFDDCGIDGLVQAIQATGACIDDGEANKATFAFEATLDSGYNNRGQVFSYRLGSNKALADGYEVTAFYVNGEKQDVPANEGSFELSENSFTPVAKLEVQVDVQATGQLDGTEALILTLDNTASPDDLTDDSPSATAKIENFDACPPDLDQPSEVALYLLMDNSTSMLLPDPSTTKANRKDRLEGQDRVALYSFEEAIAKAGYGFSRKGSDSVLSSEGFREALINNGSESLSSVLDGFDVIVNPEFPGDAKPVTVHLITYGYAVDYDDYSFDETSTKKAIKLAKQILDVKTPDQIYGNSIKSNSTWKERDLPKPNKNDRFQGDGRPSSNLYSGTEMLGALQGLEHLLSAQAKMRNASDLTTYVSMVTDGRPERRAWWDTRTGPGSDSITGVSVPLPKALGGYAVTTSGLIYDLDGNPTYLENNAGKQEWKQMQRKLNKALDAIAAKSSDPASQALQVEVMAMGESSDADFPVIYDDLFGKRTFDNSEGGWSYEVFNSFRLPDFLG